MKPTRISGFLGCVFTLLWFLLLILNPARAQEQEGLNTDGPRAEVANPGTPSPETVIADLLSAEGIQNVSRIELSPNAVPHNLDWSAVLETARLVVNKRTGRFTLRLASTPRAITGTAFSRQEVPVLAEPVSLGMTINASDITWLDLEIAGQPDFVFEADQLVGMSPRRPISVGNPIPSTAVVAPTLVERGDIVTMSIEAPGIRLTHKAIAKRAGARGDIIEVENARSGRTIRAVVTSVGQVRAAGVIDGA
ncbi:MAG: flagellar basal body P-ring formation chaperone FlgA [Pseudomonadota bacterium]